MKLAFIYCGTGCTCCNHEDHIRGPYLTVADAERRVNYFRAPDSKYWPLASQFQKRGRYEVKELEVESISNDRVIVEGRVFPSFARVIEVKPDGTIDVSPEEEYFTSEF